MSDKRKMPIAKTTKEEEKKFPQQKI